MEREKYSYARITDAQIDELVQDVQQRQRTHQSLANAPELRMTHDIRRAYQTETHEDARSLERVLTRLTEDQAEVKSKVFSLPRVYQQQKGISAMQSALNSMNASTRGKIKRGWAQRVGVLAAVLFLALLVGELLTVLSVGHTGQTSTPSSASNVITSVALSDNANQTGQAPTVQRFTVGQTIWLTSMINVGKTGSGILMVKWYENDRLYATSKRDFQAPKEQAVASAMKVIPIRAHQVYSQPGDAKVEIYWNGKLVTTLHFVVGPRAKK